jgi:hypothetical protein
MRDAIPGYEAGGVFSRLVADGEPDMSRSSIEVKVDAETAGVLAGVSREDKDKLSMLWAVLVHEYRSSPTALQGLMDEIGAKARSRGLTAAKLESILHAAG